MTLQGRASPDSAWQLGWCDVGGVRTRYAVAGEVGRPAVVLLHGIGLTLEDWSATAALATRYRLLAPDLIGFGYTGKPPGPYSLERLAAFVKDFLVTLGETGAITLIGNSLGGAVAQAFAVAYPERTERLVLVASAGFGAEVTLALRLVTIPGVGELLLRPSRRGAENTVKSLFYDPGFVTEARVLHALELARQPGAARAFLAVARSLGNPRGIKAAWRAELSRRFAAQKRPTLVVWGDHDHVLPAKHLDEAARMYPHARTHLFPRTGHLPQLERAEAFNALVLDFLEAPV